MLGKVSLQQRRAAHALSQQSWWPALKELLESELMQIYSLLTDTMNPVVLHQLQGQAKQLRDLLDLVHNAGKILAKD